MLQDEDLMLLGWGKVYSDQEVMEWIKKINQQYVQYGYSYFIIEDLTHKRQIGLAGIIRTEIHSKECDEIAYIIKKEFQRQGYATQTAQQLIQLAFKKYKLPKVIAQFISENGASKKVLENIGMTYYFTYKRHQNGKLNDHFVYKIEQRDQTNK